MYKHLIKRLLDILISGTALILLSPIYLVLTVLVRIKLGSPVLFKQARPGKRDRSGKETIFRIFKYRTMTDERDENGDLLPDTVRRVCSVLYTGRAQTTRCKAGFDRLGTSQWQKLIELGRKIQIRLGIRR